jgi:uncharacterized protein (TIGR00251 family)
MCIEACQEGVILSVRAFPGAKRNEVRGEQNGYLKVCVTQIPEKGKANEAIRKQLAQTLKLRISQIELLHGETSAQKKFLLRNVNADDLLLTPLKLKKYLVR